MCPHFRQIEWEFGVITSKLLNVYRVSHVASSTTIFLSLCIINYNMTLISLSGVLLHVMPRRAKPQRHNSHRVCLWVSLHESFSEIDVCIYPQSIREWNMQCTCSIILKKNWWISVWFRVNFVVKLNGVICSPIESCCQQSMQSPAKNKSPTTGCLWTWHHSSICQIRWWHEWNLENKTAKTTQPKFSLPIDLVQ